MDQTTKKIQDTSQSIKSRHKEAANIMNDSFTKIYQDNNSSNSKGNHDKEFDDMNDALDKIK